jgi:ankyrin repeat protein
MEGVFGISNSDFFEICKSDSSQRIIDAVKKVENVNKQDNRVYRGWTPLMLVASNSNANSGVITALFEAGAAVNMRNNDGSTPLMIAAKVGSNPEVITTLLELGADSRIKDKSGKMAIDYIKENKNLADTYAFRNLSEHFVPTEEGALIESSVLKFFELCKTGSLQQINEAIEGGEKVNARIMGRTPLMMAAESNSDPEVITALINAGADVNETNLSGRTPLLLAIDSNPNPEVIITLINAGANVNAKNAAGKTALFLATENNSAQEVITALIKEGASLYIDDDSDIIEIGIARRNSINITETRSPRSNKPARNMINFVELCKNGSLLQISEAIRNGARVNESGRGGITPLMAAAGNNTPEVVSMLLKEGANRHGFDNAGRTATDHAIMNGRFKNLEALGFRIVNSVPSSRNEVSNVPSVPSVPSRRGSTTRGRREDATVFDKPIVVKKPNLLKK